MSATTATLRGRLAAEANMVDACTIQRVTGTTTNDTTGVVTPTYTTIYSGKCRMQQTVPVSKAQPRSAKPTCGCSGSNSRCPWR
jgi:hypothetical protein